MSTPQNAEQAQLKGTNMDRRTWLNKNRSKALAAITLVATQSARASTTGIGGSGLPWETALQKLVDSFTGPVMQGVLILAIVALGFAVMWSEGPVLRRAFGLLLGGAIAAAAVSIALTLFGVSGATF